jgi:hypothetical protein
MGRALLALLTVTLASPVLWVGLMTRTTVLKLLAVTVGALLLHGWIRRRAGAGERQARHHSGGQGLPNSTVLVTVFLAAVLWMDGTLLWMLSSDAPAIQGVPLLLLGVVGIWGLVRQPRHPADGGLGPRTRPTRAPLSAGALALLWVGLGLGILVGFLGDPRWTPSAMLAAVPLALMPWSLPQCLTALGPPRQAFLRNVLLSAAGLLTVGGLIQAQMISLRFSALGGMTEPWQQEWSESEITSLTRLNRRFSVAGGDTLIATLQGLSEVRAGRSEQGVIRLAHALKVGSDQPAVVSAVCWSWGRMGALGPLVAEVSPGRVIEAGGLEAARFYTGALIAGDQFGRAKLIHQRFGDALFLTDHPVLTPQRIGAALVAWERPKEALRWFNDHLPEPRQTAESLFWRGLAEQALGNDFGARQAWETAVLIAPDHADAQAHLDGSADHVRAGPDLLANSVAGRQLVGVTVTPISPESFGEPLMLSPGQTLRVDCHWRLVHRSSVPMEVHLRFPHHESVVMHLGATSGLLAGTDALHIGERDHSWANVRIPPTLAAAEGTAQLVVTTAPGASLPQAEVFDLAPLVASPGFRRHSPRDSRQGISAANRLRLFPGGTPLGHSLSLRGVDSALLELETPRRARRVGLVSYLTGSRSVGDSQVTAQLFVSDQRGTHRAFPILAGRDTADIWHEYPPFRETMRHRLAPIAWQEPRRSGGYDFHNSYYLQEFDLEEEIEVRAIRVRSTLHETGQLHVVDMVTIPEISPGVP